MIIYGVVLLSIYTLTGLVIGQVLGALLGVPSNVGGVGIGMFLLIGAATYTVGPVTGAAIGASSEVIALSITAGLIKAILVMVAAPLIGLKTPRTAVIFGGLIGTSKRGRLRRPRFCL